jgi:hypothetical protein
MASTNIRGTQILDDSVGRADIDTTTAGQAAITKIIAGTNVTLSYTGADPGTGDVTVNFIGGGGGIVTGKISVGTGDSAMSTFIGKLIVALGTKNESFAFNALLNASVGAENASFTTKSAVGSGSQQVGTNDAGMGAKAVGSIPLLFGGESTSHSASSSIVGRGFPTANFTSGTPLWTSPGNVQADDGSVATYTVSDSLGGGASATSESYVLGNSFALAATPTGFTRSKVECLVRYNDSASGLSATGDTATFNCFLQDNNGFATIQTLFTDTYTAAGSQGDTTKVADVTSAVAGYSDANLIPLRIVCDAKFVRTLVATGTRTFTVNVDSVSIRVTYTRSSII